jgi:hypothetical protein
MCTHFWWARLYLPHENPKYRLLCHSLYVVENYNIISITYYK